LWLAALVGVFDDSAETHFSVFFRDAAENPFARLVHLNDDVGPFCWSEKNRLDFARRGNPIAVERDDVELVTGQRQHHVFGRARVKQPK
jgi:hypothetical protein